MYPSAWVYPCLSLDTGELTCTRVRIRLSLLLRDSRYIGKKRVKNCLNARAKMTSDKFDDERLLARKTNENKMKNG